MTQRTRSSWCSSARCVTGRPRPTAAAGGWTLRGKTDFERLVNASTATYLLATDLHEGTRRAWAAAGRSEAALQEAVADLEDLGGVV